MASLAVTFNDDPEGIEAARRLLDRLEAAFEGGGGGGTREPGAGVSGDGGPNPAVLLYSSVGEGSFTRAMLELLAGGDQLGMTPEEIAAALKEVVGEELSKGSARAAILNARRVEKRLRAEGRIEEQVIVADFGDYQLEGAGRYHLSSEDASALAAIAS
jgi:hypothetical protein